MTRKKKMEAPGDDFCRKMGDFSDVAPFGDESFYCLDDLLDFPGLGDGEIDACPIEDPPNANLTVSDCAPAAPPAPDSSTVTEDNCPVLCVPQDDLGDLEWLPFVNSSFSTEPPKPFLGPKMAESEGDQREPSKLSLCNPKPAVSPLNPATGTRSSPPFIPNSPLPCRARSKRSRTPACNWSSRIVSPTSSVTSFEHCHSTSAVSSDSDYFAESSVGNKKRKGNGGQQGGVMRKCSHCETTKTPQWRTGPKGPKTLCNACGVRYKSGRLVPEYRPAASPTFSPSIHSNSHRRVMEMRRNKQLGVLKGGASLFRGKVLAKQASPVSESEYSLCGFGCEEGEDSCLLPIKQDYRHFI